MDISCPKCSTQFVLDDTQIPGGGLAVQCSQCAHQFHVVKPGEGLPTNNSEQWMIRQPSGNTFTFRELTTLQRWIVERKVGRDDEISRSGKEWKRLGDIAELATFFQVVEAQTQTNASGASWTQPTVPGPSAPSQELPQPAAPAQGHPPAVGQPAIQQQTPFAAAPAQGHPPAVAQPVVQQQTPPAVAPQPAHPPAPGGWQQPTGQAAAQPPVSNSAGGGAAWEGQSQSVHWQQKSEDWQMSGSDDAYDDDDDFDFPKRRGKGWVFFLLLLLVGGGVSLYILRPDLIDQFARMIRPVDKAAVAQVANGYVQLARDSLSDIEKAKAQFRQALQIAPNFVDAHAGLAEAMLTEATKRRYRLVQLEASLQSAEASEQGAITGEINKLRTEIDQIEEQAFASATKAVSLDAAGLLPNRALAFYYRNKGASTPLEQYLGKARQRMPNDAWLLLVDASGKDDSQAVAAYQQVLATDSGLQRARFLMADALGRTGEKTRAVSLLSDLLRQVPEHKQAKVLLSQLEPPAEIVPEPPPAPEPAPAKDKPLSFDGLLTQAERAREADRTMQALQLYEKALEIEPGDLDATMGIGWCYLDLGRVAPAISSFKQVIARSPRMSDAHMGLAEAFRERGDKANAAKHYKTYLDILPDGPEAPVARRMLKQLR